jgi:WhiB family transcriptional regulator, redox-sensing transcriptional regulator
MYSTSTNGSKGTSRTAGSTRSAADPALQPTRREPPEVDPEASATHWSDRAACLCEEPELFFPIGNTGTALMQIEEAKVACNRCLVIDRCLRFALESGQDAGVWGGLTADERFALKNRTVRLCHAD